MVPKRFHFAIIPLTIDCKCPNTFVYMVYVYSVNVTTASACIQLYKNEIHSHFLSHYGNKEKLL